MLDIVDIGRICSASLSIIGTLLIILSFFLVRDWRFPDVIVFWLAVCDFLYALCCIDINPEGLLCKIQGVATDFVTLASFFWTLLIAFAYWSQLFRFGRRLFRLYKLFHIVIWSLSFVLAVVPFILHEYVVQEEPIVEKCWLAISKDYVRYWAFFAFLYLVMCLIPFFYIYLNIFLCFKKRKSHNWVTRMSLYPVVFWIIWLGPCSLRLLEQMNQHKDYPTWVAIVAITNPLQGFPKQVLILFVTYNLSLGFLNALVYGCRRDRLFTVQKQAPKISSENTHLLSSSKYSLQEDDKSNIEEDKEESTTE